MPQSGLGAAPSSGALPLAGVTVLLVEDSRFASDALRLMCQRSGARLRRAESMAKARLHLRTYCPDVVIIDLGLPDGCGDRLIRELAAARSGGVVLGLSGDPDGRRLALAAGAAGFLEKPILALGDFQRAILRHVPGRFAPTARDEPAPMGDLADPLALRDDLAHAAQLLAAGPDAGARRYLARFIAGVAHSSGDADLAAAAVAAAQDAAGLPLLHGLVQNRLSGGTVI
ncbi:response regulator [Pseudotabrizicola algicola]|uniref:Response regulator n=1 Tax=Pseudotabrizicola algicola TaxID=2709381 RepID=A0A6B3RQM7_9RHOB|nr:response regulator [Pseudotabrizicola algicola]